MTAIQRADNVSLITPDRLHNLCQAAEMTRGLVGPMAELGVYRGGSASVLLDLFPNRRLYLFDTFTGLPHTEQPQYNPTGLDLNQGRFACSVAEVESFLGKGDYVIVEGLFPTSAKDLPEVQYSFVHIDCDLYQSAKDAIAWFWPKMLAGGVMFFDDYGCDFTGVTRAVHEFFDASDVHSQQPFGSFVKKPS